MTQLTPNPSFSITMRLETPHKSGMLASIAQAIASVGGNISAIDITEKTRAISIIEVTVDGQRGQRAARY
jgi:malate dehydrogenase (oxaloacetate-decarboxylating)